MATTTSQAVRRWILTGGVAAVTITGTIYGATLKEDVEVTKVHIQCLRAIILHSVFFSTNSRARCHDRL